MRFLKTGINALHKRRAKGKDIHIPRLQGLETEVRKFWITSVGEFSYEGQNQDRYVCKDTKELGIGRASVYRALEI